MKLSVVIVNYNSGDQIGRCLAALEGASSREPEAVVVVDNHSTDGSDRLGGGSRARLISQEENIGFARAANVGIAATEGELILLLNPDVILQGGALEGMVEAMRADRTIGVLGPRIREGGGRRHTFLRPYPSNRRLLGEALFIDRIFPGRPEDGEGWLQGCCLLLRRAALEEIGAFDPGFFLYYEDVDLCYRLRGTSWRAAMETRCEVIHDLGERDSRYGEAKLRWYHTSLIAFYRKHYPRKMLPGLRCILILRCLIRTGLWICLYLAAPARREERGERVRGYAAVLRSLWRGSLNGAE